MKILITGAEGQLGGALQRTAPDWAEFTAIDLAQCDLTDSEALRSYVIEAAPDWIINAAAYTAVDRAENDEDVARAINSDAVGVMVETLNQSSGRLAHVSTDFVFDGALPRGYRPDDERAPLSVYGRTKAEGEDQLRPSDLLVRTSWVYEAGGANFVRTMLRLMAERDKLAVVCDQIGAPTRALGLAHTIWRLIERDASGTFHYSDAGVASWYDFAVAIAEEAHEIGLIARIPAIRPITSAEYPTPAQRPVFSLLDSTATRAILGEAPTHWRTHLREMLKEELARG